MPASVDREAASGDGRGDDGGARAATTPEPPRAEVQVPAEPVTAVAVSSAQIANAPVGSPADGPARPAQSERLDRPAQSDRPADSFDSRPVCTTAQLRRFIKSRPWIPMHELRRRFGIAGEDDTVSPIHLGPKTVFVGLPQAEARLMGELLASGDVGYELSLDPVTPVVVGVYPMRPVPRG